MKLICKLFCLCLAVYSLPYIYSEEISYALLSTNLDSGAVPAIELAEEMINADSSILPGYNLTHTPVVDTMCDRTVSLKEYYTATSIFRPTVLGLLGCGCAVASEPVAEIIHHNSLSQVSYATPSSKLSDRRRFPNFFRTYPSDANFAPAVVTLIQQYGWRRIAFITQDESLFTEIALSIMNGIRELDLEVASRVLSDIPSADVNSTEELFFKQDDYRVFFINSHSSLARQLLCEAYLRGYTHPRYVWLTYGWYQDRWWTEEVNPEPTNCTDHQLAEALHRSLTWDQVLPQKYEKSTTVLNLDDLNKWLYTHTKYYRINALIAGYAFDALWTFALALNRTNEMMVQNSSRPVLASLTGCNVPGELVSLENFTYSNQFMGCVIRWNLERTDFVGASGRVTFEDGGTRIPSHMEVGQYRLKGDTIDRISVAYIKPLNKTSATFLYRESESLQAVYPDSEGGIPPDGTPVTVAVTFHLALVIPLYIIAMAGLIFGTICLIFTCTQRKKKVVRLNSPNLNYLTIIGSYIMNTSIFFRIMPSPDPSVNAARCYLDTLLNTIGYCLIYGAVLSKMARIHYIFHNPTAAKKALKDHHLIIMALSIAGVGAILSVLQVSVPILQPLVYQAPNEEPPSAPMNEYGLKVNEVAWFCYNAEMKPIASAWIVLTSVYLVLLQLVGVILALRTRKVKIKVLKDSKYIVAVVYISAIALAVILLSTFALGFFPNVIEFLFSGSLLVSTNSILLMVFVPKMVSLYKDPEGKHVFDNGQKQNETSTMGTTNTNITINKERTSKIQKLESQVAALEKTLRDYETNRRALVQTTSFSEGVQPSSLPEGASLESRADNGMSLI